MTDHEWQDTRNYLFGSFPGLGTYFAKIPAGEREAAAGQWRRILGSLPTAAVRQAIDLLADGTEERPTSYERYPAAIGAIARKLTRTATRRTIGGQQTFGCGQCEDMGLVRCYAQSALEEIKAATRDRREVRIDKLNTCAVRCSCTAGGYCRQATEVVFDGKRHFVLGQQHECNRETIAAAAQWIASRAERMANYEPGFRG